jgi:hypothetical protein
VVGLVRREEGKDGRRAWLYSWTGGTQRSHPTGFGINKAFPQ